MGSVLDDFKEAFRKPQGQKDVEYHKLRSIQIQHDHEDEVGSFIKTRVFNYRFLSHGDVQPTQLKQMPPMAPVGGPQPQVARRISPEPLPLTANKNPLSKPGYKTEKLIDSANKALDYVQKVGVGVGFLAGKVAEWLPFVMDVASGIVYSYEKSKAHITRVHIFKWARTTAGDLSNKDVKDLVDVATNQAGNDTTLTQNLYGWLKWYEYDGIKNMSKLETKLTEALHDYKSCVADCQKINRQAAFRISNPPTEPEIKKLGELLSTDLKAYDSLIYVLYRLRRLREYPKMLAVLALRQADIYENKIVHSFKPELQKHVTTANNVIRDWENFFGQHPDYLSKIK
jgi:hypothetical protein